LKIYFAGNFPQMRLEEEEYRVVDWASKRGAFRRLVSFFYYSPHKPPDYTGNVIKAIRKLKLKEENENEN